MLLELVEPALAAGRDGLRQLKNSLRPVGLHVEYRAAQAFPGLRKLWGRLLAVGHEGTTEHPTVPLLERAGIPHTVISKHRGRNMAAKGYGLAARTAAMSACTAKGNCSKAWIRPSSRYEAAVS